MIQISRDELRKSLPGNGLGLTKYLAVQCFAVVKSRSRTRGQSMGRATTTAKHNAESLEGMAALFEQHAISLRAASAMLRADPPIAEIVVENESSRLKLVECATLWVSAASQTAFSERINAAQKGRTRQSGSSTRNNKS